MDDLSCSSALDLDQPYSPGEVPPSSAPRWWPDPSGLKAALAIVTATIASRAPSLSLSSIDWDEGVYIIMAQRWRLGGLPYVQVWDQHPPGLPALLAIVQNLFADPVFGARLLTGLMVALNALLLYRFAARYCRRPGAGLVAAMLYVVCMSRWTGLAANPVAFDNALVTLAAYLLYGALQRAPTGMVRASVAALALGVGLQIKYVVVAEAVVLCVAYLALSYGKDRSPGRLVAHFCLFALAGVLPTLLMTSYFWMNGALGSFLSANLDTNLAYMELVPSLREIVGASASGLAPMAGCLLVIVVARSQGVRWRWTWADVASPVTWIALWLVSATIDLCLPVKFFTHYYFALYPPLCLAGALALSIATRRRPLRFALGLALLFASAVPLWVVSAQRVSRGAKSDGPREITRVLARGGQRDLNVFVYDYNPVVYALAGVRPPTPYVLGSELRDYSYSSGQNGVRELERVMDTAPDFVVLRAHKAGEKVPEALDSVIARRLAGYHLLSEVVESGDNATLEIYAR